MDGAPSRSKLRGWWPVVLASLLLAGASACGAAPEPPAPPPEPEVQQPEVVPPEEKEPEPPPEPPKEPEPPAKDWEKGALENIYRPDPNTVRVAIINASGKRGRAGMIAFFLEQYRRSKLEDKIGKRVAVVNLSNMNNVRLRDSVVYYREGHLRAALLMADAIPGRQGVTPMKELDNAKIGIDVEIRIGTGTP